VLFMVDAAAEFGVDVPSRYADMFTKEKEPTDPLTLLLVSIADTVSNLFKDELIALAKDYADKNDVPEMNLERVDAIADSYNRWVVPIREPESLIDILNAGWKCNKDDHLWKNVAQINSAIRRNKEEENDAQSKTKEMIEEEVEEKKKAKEEFIQNRDRVLRDLILKSMDIAEIYERLG